MFWDVLETVTDMISLTSIINQTFAGEHLRLNPMLCLLDCGRKPCKRNFTQAWQT